jgi:fido (protein-threonine AMPylation protein)
MADINNLSSSSNLVALRIDDDWTTNVWWRKQYDQDEAGHKITNIIEWANKLKHFNSENNHSNLKYLNDYAQDLLKLYTRELLCGENIIEDENSTPIGHIKYIDEIISNPCISRKNIKVNNVYRVVETYFHDPFSSQLSLEDFDSNLAKRVHKEIMMNLLENNGCFRVKPAKPAGENFEYLNHMFIQKELDHLFKITVQNVRTNSEKIDNIIKLAAQFLSRFLYIHPFSNGNGRVGRILLSYLLSSVSVVPVSLYLNTYGRDTYLKCLRQSSENLCFNTKSLETFILDCTHKSIYDATFALELF